MTAPRTDARPPIAVAFFNDTGDYAHTGCLAVSQAHRHMLRRAGAVVRHAYFFRDWLPLGVGTVEEGIALALASNELRQVFAEVDAVVVNGQGTIHHGYGRHLLAILGAAQRLGVPTCLVNAVVEDVTDGRGVLAALDDCAVRDGRSATYLRSLGIPHRVVPDSIFAADFDDSPLHDFRGRLVITDCHPLRRAEFAPRLDALRHEWRGHVGEYALEAPERAGDWTHAVADLRHALVVVTGRHHGACLALRAGVPFVTLASNTWKIEGLLDLLDGYPAEAADASRPLNERVSAAMAARGWFARAARAWPVKEPLETFGTLESVSRRSWSMPGAPEPVNDRVLSALRAIVRPGGGILHAGAGEGALVRALLAEGRDAHGVDVSALLTSTQARRMHGRFVRGTPGRLPLGDGNFATVVAAPGWLEHLEEDELNQAIGEIVRVSSDAVVIQTSGRGLRAEAASGSTRSREWWEGRLFAAGLRRHTGFFAAADFESLEDEPSAACLVMQKVPAEALAAYPLASLQPERDLHMDMLRETGRRSDAHLARYEWARSWIRPGDIVVDAACGLGYGSAMLWDGSEAARVIGVDLSESAVAYARACFLPLRNALEFRVADAEGWDGWPDNSVDCIVSFETVEHLPDPARFIAGAQRVLKPGGRFLCSVPNEWADETGRDPNPFHLHVFNLETLVHTVSASLIVDEAYAQSAGGHATRFAPRRLLRNVHWPAADAGATSGAEWWLLSAIKDPLAGAAVPYVEQVFAAADGPAPNAIAFGRDYLNPWAVHALVMGSFRVRSPRLLRELAKRWWADSPPDSADAGAALCILVYRLLEESPGDVSTELLSRVCDYRRRVSSNPQVRRWQISLTFAEGLLHMRRGDFGAAETCFRACAVEDASAFTPHLETKTTEAAWLAGRLALERGAPDQAAADWAQAFSALERVKTASIRAWLLSPERPAAFEFGDGLREIAISVDNAVLSANALRALRDPAGAWRPGPRVVERNFQRNVAALLEVVHRRGGEIVALRSNLDATLDSWRVSRETLHDAERRLEQALGEARVETRARENVHEARQQVQALATQVNAERALTAQAKAERAALRRALRRYMQRVVIVGSGDVARRIWEVLAQRGTADVVGFVDSDRRRHGRPFLGSVIHPPEWLDGGGFDLVAVAGEQPCDVTRRLAEQAAPDSLIVFPMGGDDAAFARVAAERFPDPLASSLARSPRCSGRRVGIFGTGTAAMKVWEALADLDAASVAWFADNNPVQHGRTFLWVNVIKPADIRARGFDAIVVGSMSREPIHKQLRSLGVPSACILTPNVAASVEEIREELTDAFFGVTR